MDVRRIEVLADDGQAFAAYLARPPAGVGPGVVSVLGPHSESQDLRHVARSYAAAGYSALVTDVFWRFRQSSDSRNSDLPPSEGCERLHEVELSRAVSEVVSAFKTLRRTPFVRGKVAIVGFCLGGQVAYRAAAMAGSDAAVVFYGYGVERHLHLASLLACPMLFHYAENDARISPMDITATSYAFAGRQNAWFVRHTGVSHGFCCPGSAEYNPSVAAQAHEATLSFLGQHLKE